MYPAGQHPIYSYTTEDRAAILKEFEITETQLQNNIESIVDWFQKQPHLCEAGIYPQTASLYIIAAKGSVEKAKQRLDCFYQLRLKNPEFFNERLKILNDPSRQIWDTHIIAFMPKLYKGLRVSFVKFLKTDDFNVDNVLRNTFTAADIRFVHDCMAGDIWVLDFQHLTWNNIIKVNLMSIGKAFWILHDGIGLRIFQIHVINSSLVNLGQVLLNMLKPFVSKKILDRLIIHESLEDFKKTLPKEYIPKDYGGDESTMEECRDKMEKLFKNEKKFLIGACKLVSDESKRPKLEYDEDYLPGNFQKLDFD